MTTEQDDEDRELIEAAGAVGGTTQLDAQARHAFARLVVRLRDAITQSERSANALGDRIWWLNFWLLWFTIVIFTLTAVLTAVGLGIVRPLR